jgi:hypothetical protein
MCGRVGVVGLLCMYTQASVHTSIRACTQKYRQKDGNAHRFQHRTHTQREHTHAQAQQIKEEQEPPRELAACSTLAPTEAYWQGELPRLQSYVHTHMNIRYRRLYVSMCSELPHLHFYDRNHIPFRWQQLGAVSLDLRPINVSVL